MRLIHVVAAIAQEASGPSYSVRRLCEALLERGAHTELTVLAAPTGLTLPYVRRFPYGWGPRRLGHSPQMQHWLRSQALAGEVDIIHNHGLWMMPNVYTGRACVRTAAKLVVSPRGTLSKWARSHNALRKRVFWHLMQERAVLNAHCFHATSESEYEDVRQAGFKQPVCIIPNGIDVVPLEPQRPRNRRELLFLARIHPVKGIDMLLHAWRAVERKFPDWDLRIVGPGNDGHLGQMQQLAAVLRLERVSFAGPIYGAEKLDAYRAADLFVLPSRSENFGVALAEALAAGVPAIATKATPWKDLETYGVGWWIDTDTQSLTACLENALGRTADDLAVMGRAGRDLMATHYSWESVAAKFSSAYTWLLRGGERPECVRID